MSGCEHPSHQDHDHAHGAGCGHVAVRHDGHVDYLHDGHLHHPHGDHVDEHRIPISDVNPDRCDGGACSEGHTHGPECGHEAVPHGDHIDYLVDGRLHHPHGSDDPKLGPHCDDHGPLEVV